MARGSEAKPKQPRQTSWKPEQIRRVCELIADGGHLKACCKQVGISHQAFLRATETGELSDLYMRARETKVEMYADAMMETVEDVDVSDPLTASANVQKARLLADTMKWLMVKVLPKRYGDQVQVGGNFEIKVTLED